ncbi:MAG TPA: non-canonical purine NTP pyrophosphatase, partial [Rhodospirillaceae bacterium]|nr:non-canonical purine NTP pyrophosphatase [Rhodospirillaceae bacterium]
FIKAKAAGEATGIPSLADDSGLCVNALGGKPGVLSARWAHDAGSFPVAMQRLHEALKESKDRTAFFVCSLVLFWPDGQSISVEGRCDGALVWPMRGTGGHGYDPIFQPLGEMRTFAEMEASEKDNESHRGRALRALAEMFSQK